MAFRIGFAAASALGVVTSFGTGLWLAAVMLLFGLIAWLLVVEAVPALRRDRS